MSILFYELLCNTINQLLYEFVKEKEVLHSDNNQSTDGAEVLKLGSRL